MMNLVLPYARQERWQDGKKVPHTVVHPHTLPLWALGANNTARLVSMNPVTLGHLPAHAYTIPQQTNLQASLGRGTWDQAELWAPLLALHGPLCAFGCCHRDERGTAVLEKRARIPAKFSLKEDALACWAALVCLFASVP